MGKAKDSGPGPEPTQTTTTPENQATRDRAQVEPPAQTGVAPLPQGSGAGDQTPSQVTQLSELAAELERQRNELRDYEKALVERIADVDDDRRMTTSKLQRAWQTQREAIDDQWRRHTGITVGSLVLLALLVAVALFLLYRQIGVAQGPLVESVSEIRLELDRVAGGDGQDEAIEGRLTRLVDDISETSSSLAQLNQERERAVQAALAGERASREQGDADIVAELHVIKDEQRHLKQELASLREALTATAAGSRSGTAADDGMAEQKVAELRVIKDEQRHLEQELRSLREALTAATAGSRSGPATDDGMAEQKAEAPGGEEAVALAQPLPDETASLPVTEAHSPKATGGGAGAGAAATDADADADAGEQVGGTAQESDPAVADGEGRPTSDVAEPVAATGESLAVGGPSYAVQLIGFYDMKSLVEFARREGLPARAYYLRQTFNDRPWYAMIHSLHDTYSSAAAELSGLPAELAGLNPWIRPLPPGTDLEPLETGPARENGDP